MKKALGRWPLIAVVATLLALAHPHVHGSGDEAKAAVGTTRVAQACTLPIWTEDDDGEGEVMIASLCGEEEVLLA